MPAGLLSAVTNFIATDLMAAPLLWVGPLAVGDTVTIEFDVVVDDPVTGNHSLVNTVVSPPESNCDRGSSDLLHGTPFLLGPLAQGFALGVDLENVVCTTVVTVS